jgi:hypothetical protein
MARASHGNAMCQPPAVEVGSGNVFADLGAAPGPLFETLLPWNAKHALSVP